MSNGDVHGHTPDTANGTGIAASRDSEKANTMRRSGSYTSIGVDSDIEKEDEVGELHSPHFKPTERVDDSDCGGRGTKSVMPRPTLARSRSREKLDEILRDQEASDKLFEKDVESELETMIREATLAKEALVGNMDSKSEMRRNASQMLLTEMLDLGVPTPRMRHASSSDSIPDQGGSVEQCILEAKPVSVQAMHKGRIGSRDDLGDDSFHSVNSTGSNSGDDAAPHTMEEIIAVCINKVCKRRKFGLGNIWIVHDERLVCAPTYQTVATSSEKLQFFGDRCREMTFARGEGLPGRTWETLEAMWEANVQRLSLEQYPRLEIAKACGVKT